MKLTRLIIILIACASMAGCAASGMKDVKKSGFLNDYSKMEEGTGDRAALYYVKKEADFKRYDKIMFDRIMVDLHYNPKHTQIDPAMLAELTTYYQNTLIKTVEKGGYKVVEKPGPNVLRIRTALTHVEASSPVSNTLSSIVPVGMIVAGATKAVSDSNLGTGQAGTEMDILNSMTNTRLAAAVDRRQGGKGAFRGEWQDTKDAFDYWAARLLTRLNELRK